MKLLLSAFDPFGGESANASLEILNVMPDRLGSIEIAKLLLPTVFTESARLIRAAMDTLVPDAVVCLGQAAGRDALTPERVAINVMDARIPDNAGYQPVDVPIDPEGPAAYFSTLPIRAMAGAMLREGVSARISDSAGTFVCNSVMYAMLRHADRRGLSVPCGFIHLPCLDDLPRPSPAVPALPRADVVRALTAALKCLES